MRGQSPSRRAAVIGAGITGLAAARLLSDTHAVVVYERQDRVGGLIRCDRVRGNLFHRVGGHVFNSREKAVLDWFWSCFDRETEFVSVKRNAKIWMGGKIVGYPIENHLWQLDRATVQSVVSDMLEIQASGDSRGASWDNFEEFLRGNFGDTLYNLYFGPYNQKIWNTDLSMVPLAWLDGKLPMPDWKQMMTSNIMKDEESAMVHSTFYYARENGSQFIADRLAETLDVRTSCPVQKLEKRPGAWCVNGELFDDVIYTGDARRLAAIMEGVGVTAYEAAAEVQDLRSNGTSNMFCESDPTDISWLYLPELDLQPHRIIYTGGFAPSNNRGSDRSTCVVEFSGQRDIGEMEREIQRLPGRLTPLAWNYEPNSYVVQRSGTRDLMRRLKTLLERQGLHIAGRFAEWEYYNMDKAIEAAMKVARTIQGTSEGAAASRA